MTFVRIALSLLLLFGGLLFAWFSGQVFLDEIWPTLRAGGLDVDTDSMILNRTWRGNQIYIVVVLYAAISLSLLYGGIRLARAVLSSRH